MTPSRIALHNLAFELRMTVSAMAASMTTREFGDWVAWFRLRREKDERERRERAGVQATASGGFSLDLTTESGVNQLAGAFKGKG